MKWLRPAFAFALACAAAAWVLLKPAPPPEPAFDLPVVEVPSGQAIYFAEVIRSERGAAGLVYRFRFIAPGIARDGGTVTPEQARDDMQALCDGFGIDHLPSMGPTPGQLIISLSDRATAFGEPAPEATQYFEAYRVEDGKCVWEMF
ncbi:DUF6497 family protein [Frigidibacter sp. ROC022]|uniref:DUF6497 family protein n=1 Tax=Frigidibacter sp. ROC022 TaxID=2971796 RepID=UPI00215A77D7|nr:DUF6497 family protein [Frigidibacter sp. ROC022]MCR8723130.1 DUF6497 family protein [Frigidibacter sp. ROC022]